MVSVKSLGKRKRSPQNYGELSYSFQNKTSGVLLNEITSNQRSCIQIVTCQCRKRFFV